MLKREDTLALFVDVLVRVFIVLSISNSNVLLTSTPDSTGKKQRPERKEQHSLHGIMQCTYKHDEWHIKS